MNKPITKSICSRCGKIGKGEYSCCDFLDQHNHIAAPEDVIQSMPASGSDLRELRQSMSKAMLQTQISLEHTVYLDKKGWAERHELSKFVFGSADRQMLFWMFAIDPIGEGFSPKTAGEYLQRDRTSVSKELTTMHDFKLIHRNTRTGFQRYYLPSQRLLDAAIWFAEYYVDVTLRITEEPARDRFFKYREAERAFFSAKEKRGTNAQ